MPTKALSSVDDFYRNAFLLSDDLEKIIEKRKLTDNLTRLCGPEGQYWINLNASEAFRLFIFEADGKIRFFYICIKVHDNYLRGSNSPGFKSACETLSKNPLFPLLLGIGYFNVSGKKENFFNNKDLMRHWVRYSILIGINHDHINYIENIDKATDLENHGRSICFGKDFHVNGLQGHSWWSVNSTVRVYDLFSINDSAAVENKAYELLNM